MRPMRTTPAVPCPVFCWLDGGFHDLNWHVARGAVPRHLIKQKGWQLQEGTGTPLAHVAVRP